MDAIQISLSRLSFQSCMWVVGEMTASTPVRSVDLRGKHMKARKLDIMPVSIARVECQQSASDSLITHIHRVIPIGAA